MPLFTPEYICIAAASVLPAKDGGVLLSAPRLASVSKTCFPLLSPQTYGSGHRKRKTFETYLAGTVPAAGGAHSRRQPPGWPPGTRSWPGPETIERPPPARYRPFRLRARAAVGGCTTLGSVRGQQNQKTMSRRRPACLTQTNMQVKPASEGSGASNGEHEVAEHPMTVKTSVGFCVDVQQSQREMTPGPPGHKSYVR